MKLARLIVTFFYIGNAKIAPGSIASLITTLIFYLFAKHVISYLFIVIILSKYRQSKFKFFSDNMQGFRTNVIARQI